jgi:hypothetical protein
MTCCSGAGCRTCGSGTGRCTGSRATAEQRLGAAVVVWTAEFGQVQPVQAVTEAGARLVVVLFLVVVILVIGLRLA